MKNRLIAAAAVLLGAPCVVARNIDVTPVGLHVSGKRSLVNGVRFWQARVIVHIHPEEES